MIVDWHPERPKKSVTNKITDVLLSGGIIAYPTDTLYGLGCDFYNVRAVRKLSNIKKLDEKKALSIICRSFSEVSTYAVMNDFAFKIMKSILPGPYTVILKAKKIVPKIMMTVRKEIGIRIPSHKVPIGLANLIDRPIINTSARVVDGEILCEAREIEERLKGLVDLVIDGGILRGEPSSIIRIVENRVEVIRRGKGPTEFLLQ
jgi:tRNA threonylcarbamoyl adenosine modification protein (Sua5/YciO/YrdC/YwlC family)